jgi:hypothetical protein
VHYSSPPYCVCVSSVTVLRYGYARPVGFERDEPLSKTRPTGCGIQLLIHTGFPYLFQRQLCSTRCRQRYDGGFPFFSRVENDNSRTMKTRVTVISLKLV